MVLIPDSLNIENMSLRHPQTTLLELGMLIPKLDKVEIKKDRNRSRSLSISLWGSWQIPAWLRALGGKWATWERSRRFLAARVF